MFSVSRCCVCCVCVLCEMNRLRAAQTRMKPLTCPCCSRDNSYAVRIVRRPPLDILCVRALCQSGPGISMVALLDTGECNYLWHKAQGYL